MNNHYHPRTGFVILFASVVGLALFLRLYHRINSMEFLGDQGSALLVASRIVHEGFRPMVGPLVSVPNLFIPPIYYYLVAVFVSITHDPAGVALFFLGMNMVMMGCLYYLARSIGDSRTGLITVFLFAVSFAMIEHGRSMWEPYPAMFFLTLSLVALYTSFRSRNEWQLVAASILYGLSLATYPSPFLLLPYYILQFSAWFRRVYHWSRWQSLAASGTLLLISTMPFFFPQIIFEVGAEYPTLKAVQSGSFTFPSPMRSISVFISSAGMLLYDFFRPLVILQDFPILRTALFGAVAVGVLLGLVFRREQHAMKSVLHFVQPFWLAIGLLLTVVYQKPMYVHRLWIYYPFIFLMLGVWVRRWLGDGWWVRRLTASVIVALFAVGNVTAWFRLTIQNPRNDVPFAKTYVQFVRSDSARRGVPGGAYSVHIFSPSDAWDYDATPAWYMLRLWQEYPVVYTAQGNDTARGGPEDNKTIRLVYLACRRYERYDDAVQKCVTIFRQRNPQYTLVSQRVLTRDSLVFTIARQQ